MAVKAKAWSIIRSGYAPGIGKGMHIEEIEAVRKALAHRRLTTFDRLALRAISSPRAIVMALNARRADVDEALAGNPALAGRRVGELLSRWPAGSVARAGILTAAAGNPKADADDIMDRTSAPALHPAVRRGALTALASNPLVGEGTLRLIVERCDDPEVLAAVVDNPNTREDINALAFDLMGA